MESSGEKGLHSLPASCLKPKACWSVHWRVKLAPEASLKVRRASMATFPPARQLWATLGAIFFPHQAVTERLQTDLAATAADSKQLRYSCWLSPSLEDLLKSSSHRITMWTLGHNVNSATNIRSSFRFNRYDDAK
eukprot:6189121-Pleurochrysis_carterae.AAC.3